MRSRSDSTAMREFWNAKARENAMYYISSDLDYTHTDEGSFWESGAVVLDRTLAPFELSIAPHDAVVEIGCGIGRITRELARRAGHVVGIDVSTEMIERGRKALRDLDNVELVVGSGLDLSPLADASGDVVYSFVVFQHVPDPSIVCNYIREIGRVLRPGGWSVFQVSERPEIHLRQTWQPTEGPRARISQLLGRRPRGCLRPEWLGSSLAREDLHRALSDGGLDLRATVGDGTQFCLVHARKPE